MALGFPQSLYFFNWLLHDGDMTNLGRASAYFWWVAFLRASPDYWWICQEKGNCLDPRLVQVWRDFGDLYRYETFSEWWQERGDWFLNGELDLDYVANVTWACESILADGDSLPDMWF
ncbi:MAG: hypothetical protein EBX71_12410, partial [Betaproteobacteria bacterium]|nr:hypothetical protein [Betaproteobacteria bacterium]